MKSFFAQRSLRIIMACLLVCVFIIPTTAMAGSSKGYYITTGTSFSQGDYLLSQNGAYEAIWQVDGNFVIYRTYDMKALWSTGTNGKNATQFVYQTDGNLVMYSSTNYTYQQVGWSYQYKFDPFTGTYSWVWAPDYAWVPYTTTTPIAIWNSKTAGTPAGSTLAMQNDGNLVMYSPTGRVLWSSGTNQY